MAPSPMVSKWPGYGEDGGVGRWGAGGGRGEKEGTWIETRAGPVARCGVCHRLALQERRAAGVGIGALAPGGRRGEQLSAPSGWTGAPVLVRRSFPPSATGGGWQEATTDPRRQRFGSLLVRPAKSSSLTPAPRGPCPSSCVCPRERWESLTSTVFAAPPTGQCARGKGGEEARSPTTGFRISSHGPPVAWHAAGIVVDSLSQREPRGGGEGGGGPPHEA